MFPISECNFSEKDDPGSRVLRLEMSGTKFYCHRNRVVHQDQELIGAIFHPDVKKIEDLPKWENIIRLLC